MAGPGSPGSPRGTYLLPHEDIAIHYDTVRYCCVPRFRGMQIRSDRLPPGALVVGSTVATFSSEGLRREPEPTARGVQSDA